MTPMVSTTRMLLDSLHGRWVACVEGMPEETYNWQPLPTDTNSVAQLVRHTTAVQNFLLARAAGDDVQHDHEYSLRNDPATRAELLGLLHDAHGRLDDLLPRVDSLDMTETFLNRRGVAVTRGWYVVHPADHGAEHLGHAELTAQMYEKYGAGQP